MILRGFMLRKYFVTKDYGFVSIVFSLNRCLQFIKYFTNYSNWCNFVQSFRIEKTI